MLQVDFISFRPLFFSELDSHPETLSNYQTWV